MIRYELPLALITIISLTLFVGQLIINRFRISILNVKSKTFIINTSSKGGSTKILSDPYHTIVVLYWLHRRGISADVYLIPRPGHNPELLGDPISAINYIKSYVINKDN